MKMQQIFEILAEIEPERIADREMLKRIMEEMNAKADGKLEVMLARMREYIKSGQAEMRSTIRIFESDLKGTIQRAIRAAIQSVRSDLDEMTACQEATETELHPVLMQSIDEH
jgi:hypothetical protein